jgi:integrase
MREPKLRKKKVGKHRYYYTEANGEAYFGKVGDVPFETARDHFREHLGRKQALVPVDALTVGKLFSTFLTWVKANRSDATYRRRKSDCSRFGRFVFGGQRLAELPALEVTGPMLEAWRDNLKADKVAEQKEENDRDKRGLDPQSLLHAETSIRHAFNWGCNNPSPESLLPVTFLPFRSVERTKVDPKGLTEADLLKDAEVDALLEAAQFDVDQFRRWGIEKHIEKHGRNGMRPFKDSFVDMIRIYHATGARTSELAVARVRQFSARSRQIVLGKHKRSKTQKVATVRHINLGDEAIKLLQQRCDGRGEDEFIFMTAWNKPWTKKTVNRRLHSVGRIARALGHNVRKGVTAYDFRHLWISDALMSGVDIITVAKMAGTSVKMIETVYGHFRTDHFAEAQRRLERVRKKRRQKAKKKAAKK